MSEPAPTARSAHTLGRGALFIALGKVVFMVAGAAINFVLPRLLSAADYGDYGVVVRLVSLLNMMTVMGLLQGVSKLVSERPIAAAPTIRGATRVALLTSSGVAALFALASPLVATLLNDQALWRELSVASLITAGYGLYAVGLGAMNGLERFTTQAGLDMTFSVAKVTCILGGALLLGGTASHLPGGLGALFPTAQAGLGTVGAVAGFATAALLLVVISHLVVWRIVPSGGPADQPLATRDLAQRLLAFAGIVMLYQAALNAQMSIDLLVVKRLASGAQADTAGLYNAAVNLAQLPYFGVLTITFVAFPLVSSSTFASDHASAQRYVATAMRYAVLVAVVAGCAVVANGADLLALLFPARYGEAVGALAILGLAYTVLALQSVGCAVLNAAGRPQVALAAATSGLVVGGSLSTVLAGPHGSLGAAVGTVVGALLALGITVLALVRITGSAGPLRTWLRASAAGLILAGAGLWLPARGRWLAAPMAVATAGLFVGLLVVTRELGRDDLRQLLAPFKRAPR